MTVHAPFGSPRHRRERQAIAVRPRRPRAPDGGHAANPAEAPDLAAALVRAHVRFGGDIEMLGETLPTAGKELNVLGAAFMEVDEAGKITRRMRVRDTLGIVRQLGLSPEHMRRLAQKLEERMEQPPSRAA